MAPYLRRQNRRIAFIVTLLGAAAVDCTTDGPTSPTHRAPTLASVRLSGFPQDDVVVAGATIGLRAEPLDGESRAIASAPVTWASSDTTIMVVSPAGELAARSPGSATLSVTAGGVTTTAAFTVTTTPALQFSAAPGGTIATKVRSASGAAVLVEVRDASNALVTTATTVTAAIASGTGTLAGTWSTASVNGVATFDNLKITGIDLYTLTFSAPGYTPVTSGIFSGNRPATQVGIKTQPVGGYNGKILATTPLADFRDADGYKVLSATGTITVTDGSGKYALSGATTSALNPGPNGAGFQSLVASGPPDAGAFTLVFSAPGLVSAISNPVTVTQRQAALAITTPPAGAVTGVAFTTQPVIEVRDDAGYRVAGGTCPVRVTKNTGPGTLAPYGTLSQTSAVDGVVHFAGEMIAGAGDYTLLFAGQGCAGSVVSTTFTVAPAPPAWHLQFTAAPAGTIAGKVRDASGQNVVLEVRDTANAIVTAPLTVTAAVASGSGSVTATTTAATVSGVATFSNLKITGSDLFTLAFSAPGVTGATSAPFSANRTPTQVGIKTQPVGGYNGKILATTPLADFRDADGYKVLEATGTITVGVGSGAYTLSGATTSVLNPGPNGAGFQTLVASGAPGSGPFTLVFSAPGLASATSSPVTVTQREAAVAIVTQPAGAVSGAPFLTQPMLEIRDDAGYKVATSSCGVRVTRNTGPGTLAPYGTLSQTAAVSGVVTFANEAITGAGDYTLLFAGQGCANGVISAPFTVAAAAAPGSVVNNGWATQFVPVSSAIAPLPSVLVKDGSGNPAVGVPVQWALSGSAPGSISGVNTFTGANGVATLGGWTLAATDDYVNGVTATVTGLPAVTFIAYGMPPGHLAITKQPAGTVGGLVTDSAGSSIAVRLMKDATASSSQAPAVVTAHLNGTGTLAGTTSVVAAGGNAVFTDLHVTGSGVFTLTFTTDVFTSVTTVPFSANRPATQVGISRQPVAGSNGQLLNVQPWADLRDADGYRVLDASATITASVGSGSVTLLGGTTAPMTVSAAGAVFTSLSAIGNGSYTLVFSAPGMTSATSNTISIGQTTAALAVVTQPAGAVDGSPFTTQPVVEMRDALGFRVVGSTCAVQAAINTGTGTLSPTGAASQVTAVDGVATFTNLAITGTGGHSLKFTMPVCTGTVNSTSFTVASSSVVPAIGLTSTPGFSWTIGAAAPAAQTVNVTNTGFGSLTDLTLGTVTYGPGETGWLNASLSGAAAPATVSLSVVTAGLVAGSYSATVPVQSATASNSPQSITVNLTVLAAPPPPPATKLVIVTPAAGAVSYHPFTTQPVIEIRDASNNRVLGATNPVTVVMGGGTLVGTLTVNAVNGVATFTDLQINGGIAGTLQYSSPGLTGTFSSPPALVRPPASIAIIRQPGSMVNAVKLGIQPQIEFRDSAGVAMGSAAQNITASLTSGAGVLTGTLTATGLNFFDLKITGHGTFALTFTAAGLAPVVSDPIVEGVPSQLASVNLPAGADHHVLTTQPIVEIRDAGGVKVGAVNQVTVAIASGTGTLSGTTTVTAVNGTATFTNLQINGGGAFTLGFTASGLTAATTSSFTLTELPYALGLANSPHGDAGSVMDVQPVVEIRDPQGARVPGATNVVKAVLEHGTGTLSGTTTVTAVDGVATFTDLKFNGVPQIYSIKYTSTGLGDGYGATLGEGTGVPSTIAIVTQPAGAVSGVPFTTQPVIEILDVNGVRATSATTAVGAYISGGGTLSGTTAVAAVNGLVTFTDLKIAGSVASTKIQFYTQISAGFDRSVYSSSFAVTQGAGQLAFTAAPGGTIAGKIRDASGQPVKVEVRDAANLLIGTPVVVTAQVATGGGSVGGTFAVSTAGGVATFDNLLLTGSDAFTISFSTPGAPTLTSAVFSGNRTATQLGLKREPASVTNGVTFNGFTLELRDQDGLKVLDATGTITQSLASGSVTITGPLTADLQPGPNGASFPGLMATAPTGAGPFTMTFTMPGYASVTTDPIAIVQHIARLAVVTQPAGAVSGVPFTTQPVIEVRDDAGFRVAGATCTVWTSISSGSGTLAPTGTPSTTAAVDGVVTFANLKITGAGSFKLQFVGNSCGTTATTGTFSVAP